MNKKGIILAAIFVIWLIPFTMNNHYQTITASGTGDWPPPASGQWTITQETVVENEEFTLNGSVEVQSGGKLILKNCDITMNSTSHGEVFIDVLSGGNITILSSNFNAADKYAWYLETADGSTCRIEDSTFIGVKEASYDNELLQIDSQNSVFRRNTIHNASKAGVRFGSNALYSLIEDNYVYDIIDYGLWVSYADHSFIINNTTEFVENWGLMVYGAENVTIQHNDVSNCYYGFWVQVSNNFTLDSNVVSDCGIYSMYLGTSTNGTIINNEVFNPYSFGYELSYEQLLWDNNFVDGKEVIMITESSDLHIADNVVEYPDSIGQLIILECTNIEVSDLDCNSIYVRDSSELNIYNNYISDGGIYSGNSIKIIINNNTITNAGSSGMMNHFSTNMTIKQNLIYDCPGIGISLQNGDFSEIIGNTIINCSYGIYLSGGTNMLVALNKIYDAKYRGLGLNIFSSQIFSNYIYSCPYSLDISGGDGILIYKNAFVNPEIEQATSIIGVGLQLFFGTIGNYWSDLTDYEPYDLHGYIDLFPIIDINDFWNYYHENLAYLDEDPPTFLVSQVSGEITPLTSVTITAEIIDMLLIDEAILGFSLDNQISWNNISMILDSSGGYYCTIPAGLPENTIVFYQVVASDIAGNSGASTIYNFTTANIDLEGPMISSYYTPEIIIQNKEFIITAIVEDESVITNVTLYYSIDGGENWISVNMSMDDLVDFKWTATLSIETEEDNPFMYYIEAVDEFGNKEKTPISVISLKTSFQAFLSNPLANILLGALVGLVIISITYGMMKLLAKKTS